MVNKVILIGNVGADPEIRTLETGVKVARIRIATTERIYNRQTQETKEHTEWHSITLWRNMAEFADKFIRKGSQVYVEGRIRSREWTDDAGNKRTAMDIVADEFRSLGKRSDSPIGTNVDSSSTNYSSPQPAANNYAAPSSAPKPAAAPQAAPTPVDDPDDLPF